MKNYKIDEDHKDDQKDCDIDTPSSSDSDHDKPIVKKKITAKKMIKRLGIYAL